jgi:hypothetical protein
MGVGLASFGASSFALDVPDARTAIPDATSETLRADRPPAPPLATERRPFGSRGEGEATARMVTVVEAPAKCETR